MDPSHSKTTNQQSNNGFELDNAEALSNFDAFSPPSDLAPLSGTVLPVSDVEWQTSLPSYDSRLPDSNVGWAEFHVDDDFFIHHGHGDETMANALCDLTSMSDQHMADKVATKDNVSSQKRQREDEEANSSRPTKRAISTIEARRMINEIVSRRTFARERLETARTQLNSCQQNFDKAKKEMQWAEQAVSEASQQLCDKLLEEDTSWNAMYQELVKYFENHGHTRVPRNPSKEQKEDDPNVSKLSGWVGRQRRDYRRPPDDDRRPEEYQIIALERLHLISTLTKQLG